MTEFRRYIAIEKDIKDITKTDNRVQIIGTVLSVEDNTLILDDSDSSIQVHFDKKPAVSPGELVRVFAIMQVDELKGEIIQKPGTSFDLSLYRKTKRLFDDYSITM